MEKNCFQKIYYWFRYDFKYLPYNIKNGIKNLYFWFPTIWYDRDYDYTYIYEVLKVKLEKQAKYMTSKDRFVSTKREVEKMLLTARLIEIQQNELYDMEHTEYFESDMRFEEINKDHEAYNNSKDGKLYEMVVDYKNERYEEYFSKYPRQYKKVLSGELSRYSRRDNEDENKRIYAMEIAHENQFRSKELLFKILNNNIQKWWD
jgi:hypothetical protein